MAQSQLDNYRSPHVLDLSKARYIERVQPQAGGVSDFSDLPGSDILTKLYIFQLLSFENSEVLNGAKKAWQSISRVVSRPFKPIDMSPKLPLVADKGLAITEASVWQEVSFVNFAVYVGVNFMKMVRFLYNLTDYLYQNWREWQLRDEIVEFHLRPVVRQAAPIASQLSGKANASIEERAKAEIAQPSLAKKKAAKEAVLKKLDQKIGPSLADSISKTLKEFNWRPRQISIKAIVAFAVIALILVLPFKFSSYWEKVSQTRGVVLGEAEKAMSSLGLAQDDLTDLNFGQAEDRLAEAEEHFVSAKGQLNEIRSFLTVIAEGSLISNSFKSGKNLLELGEHLSSAGEHLVRGLDELSGSGDFSLTSRIKNFGVESKLALAELELAQNNLKNIKAKHVPEESRDKFEQLKNNLPVFMASLQKTDRLVSLATEFLGDNDLRRYLLVFQNDNELRATGGFMGSFALVDLKSGALENISVPPGGTYDVRAGFNELLASPKPMQLVNPRWEFQDANWWPDFPTSAKEITWFYEKSGGPSIDGVIAINSDWLGNLLAATGPIDMPDYGKTITAANFEQEIQTEVEIEHDDIKQPKKILGDLAPQLIDKIFNFEPEGILKMATAVGDGLNQKDIMIYLDDPELQEFVSALGWDAGLKEAPFDYLNVVATNIGGGKTDNVVNQKIQHQAKILEDGSVLNMVLISRYHFGPIDETFTNIANRSYLRTYVPKGSKLIRAVGFIQPHDWEFREVEEFLAEDERLALENNGMVDSASGTRIYEENGKTVFGNWLTINPGQSQDLLLIYRLPKKIEFSKVGDESLLGKFKSLIIPKQDYGSYSLLIQKQPGSNNDEVTSNVVYPSYFNTQLVYPHDYEQISSQEVGFDGELTEDLFYFVGLNK